MLTLSGPPPTPKKSGFGGLRRLGTVLSRPGKESKGMERIDRPSSPDKEKRSRTSRNPLRRGPSSRQDMQTIPDDIPEPPRGKVPSSPPQLDAPMFSSSTNDALGIRTNQVNGDRARDTPTPKSSMPNTNGIQTGREPETVPEASTASKKALEVGFFSLTQSSLLINLLSAMRKVTVCRRRA